MPGLTTASSLSGAFASLFPYTVEENFLSNELPSAAAHILQLHLTVGGLSVRVTVYTCLFQRHPKSPLFKEKPSRVLLIEVSAALAEATPSQSGVNLLFC